MYSLPEFRKWWEKELKKFKGKTPTISRLDHEKDYSFDNIEIMDKSDNSIERQERLGPPKGKTIKIKGVKVKTKKIFLFRSMYEAIKVTGDCKHSIKLRMSGKIKRPSVKGYMYEHVEGLLVTRN